MANEKKKGQYTEYFSDKKTIMTMVAMSFAFLFVILLSVGIQFTFRDFNDTNFWTDLAINFALCVYCLYFGIPEAKNLYEKKKDGRYQVATIKFFQVRDINNKKDVEFNQWLDKYYKESRKDYFNSILSIHGIENTQVLDLDFYEIDELKNPFKKCWNETEFKGREDTYFRTLTEEQIAVVKAIYRGEIKVDKIPNDYFKTINGRLVSSEYIERQREQKRQTRKYALLIGYRVLMVFMFAFVFALFGWEQVEGSNVLESIISLIFRLWTMISSFTYGFAVGKVMTTDKCNVIEYKLRVNQLFINDTGFKALSEKELAKKEFEEYEKSKVVVELEPINNKTIMIGGASNE